MLSVEQALTSKFPRFFERNPAVVTGPLVKFLRLLFHEREINHFLESNGNLGAFELIEKVLEYFQFGYSVSNIDKENIPATGKVVIVANHPLGALDALALIRLVREVRKDVKVVANDLLMHLPPLRPLLLPVDNFSRSTSKQGIQRIIDSLENEEAVIIFPSGEVSRVRPTGIKDARWHNGFLRFAKKTQAPILPVFIDARNSALFYGLSMLYKPLAALLLVHEMFGQRAKMVRFKVGEPVPFRNLDIHGVNGKTQVKLVKRHLYQISRNKKGVFATEKCVAHPEDRQLLKRELKGAELLGVTADQKKIYLCRPDSGSALLREIGRLREVTFRAVGEGTGKRRDLDAYDAYYKHLVLWDDEELEVVGAYRLGESNAIMAEHGPGGFYTRTLFEFKEGFLPYLENSVELGRSFVQPRYWGSRALDYLWHGIGAYLRARPHIRYLFGPVSISNSYSKLAKDLLVHFYGTHFGARDELVLAKHRYLISKGDRAECSAVVAGEAYSDDFRALKRHLAQLDAAVPTLYKQYSELCEPGGVRFLDFGIDPDFENCVDGFILVEVAKIKEAKRKRYMGEDAVSAEAA